MPTKQGTENMLPTSKLEAVNEILSCVGETPVNSLSSGYVEADMALNTLNTVDREVQSQGWNFNTETSYTINPSTSGDLVLPANTLKADGSTKTLTEDWVQRGGKMYNRITHSQTAATAVKVDLTIKIEFEELPEAARRYITLRAARLTQDRTLGLPYPHSFSLQDEQQALIELRDMDADVNDFSIFDSFDTYQIVNRTGGRVR
jgi:hypothetical protein